MCSESFISSCKTLIIDSQNRCERRIWRLVDKSFSAPQPRRDSILFGPELFVKSRRTSGSDHSVSVPVGNRKSGLWAFFSFWKEKLWYFYFRRHKSQSFTNSQVFLSQTYQTISVRLVLDEPVRRAFCSPPDTKPPGKMAAGGWSGPAGSLAPSHLHQRLNDWMNSRFVPSCCWFWLWGNRLPSLWRRRRRWCNVETQKSSVCAVTTDHLLPLRAGQNQHL